MNRIVIKLPVLTLDPSATYLVVEMTNVPGVLAGILDVLRDLGVNVLGGIHGRGEAKDKCYWIALVQIPEGMENMVEEKLRMIRSVVDVRIGVERYGKLGLPQVEIVWELAPGMPTSIWRHMFLSMMYEGLRQAMGANAKAVLYHQGYQAGKLVSGYWRKTMRVVRSEVLLRGAFRILQRLGWFTHAEILELDPRRGKITVTVKDNFEAYRRRSDKPVCYFTAGLFSGYISSVLGRKVEMRETHCQARGDLHCIFTTQPLNK